MDASLACATTSFLERAASILERVEHRCAVTAHDEELVYRMRYNAYARQNVIQPSLNGRLFDEHYDRSPNHYNIMTFLDDALASTFRIHVDSGENGILPSLADFGEVLRPILRAGCLVIDLTRMAADSDYAVKFPELSYITMRAAWLAAEHFGADVIISTCFGEHQSFYKRVFGFQTLCMTRPSARIDRPIACMALDYPARRTSLEDRYPFFVSTPAERLSIFGPIGSPSEPWRR